MNDDPTQQILVEVRKLRQGLRSAVASGAAVLLTILVFCLWFSRPSSALRPNLWGAARQAMEHQEYERAASLIQRIVAKYPDDYNGYAYLGNIALITGQTKQAEDYYARADQLFPSEQNEKMLATIRKRLAQEASPPASAIP